MNKFILLSSLIFLGVIFSFSVSAVTSVGNAATVTSCTTPLQPAGVYNSIYSYTIGGYSLINMSIDTRTSQNGHYIKSKWEITYSNGTKWNTTENSHAEGGQVWTTFLDTDPNNSTTTTSVRLWINAQGTCTSDPLDTNAIRNSLVYYADLTAGDIGIALIEPSNGSTLSSDGTNFTVLGTINGSSYNYTWKNVTYYIWNINGTLTNQTTITANLSNITNSTQFIDLFTLGQNYLWNVNACYGNNTFNACAWSSNGNFTYFNLPFDNEVAVYNATGIETGTETYNLTIDANPVVSSVSAYFWYNGSRYTSTPNSLGNGSYKFSNTLDIPLQNASGNKTFLWAFTFTLEDSSVINSNSTTFQQTVNQLNLVYCNATYTIPYVNFSSKSATNPFPAINATIKTAWSYYLSSGSGTVKKTYNYENLTETLKYWAFCSNINNSIITDVDVEYDATGYALNFYYLSNASLSNATQNIILYLLNDTRASATVVRVIDDTQSPLVDHLVQVQFYDVGTGTFYLVAMGKTNFNGEDVFYLNWADTLYKFIIIDPDGTTVKTTGTTKITATPTIISVDDDFTFSLDKFNDFEYSLTFQNSTNNFILTYTKPSGLVQGICLDVYKEEATGNTQICNVCETSASATLFCNVGSYGNGTFIANFYATGSWWEGDWLRAYIGGTFQEEIFDLLGNDDASFYAFLFSGIVTFAMFVHPVVGIIALILGLLGSAALGFTAMQWGAFIGISIVGGIIIWIIKR